MIGRRRDVVLTLVFLGTLLGSTAACAQPGVRILDRDVETSGAPEVDLGEMGPMWEEDSIAEALERLDEGSWYAAANELPAWIEANTDDDRMPYAVFALTLAMHEAERYDDVLEWSDRCLAVAPLFEDYCLYWGADAAYELGDMERAEAWSAAVDGQAVYGPRSAYLRGRVLRDLSRYEEAIAVFEAFLQDYDYAWYADDVAFDLADAFRSVESYDEAARVYSRLALLNPDSSTESRAEEELDEILGELTADVRAEVEDRSNAETVQRASVLFDRHRSEQVIDLLESVIASAPTGSEEDCQAHWMTGKSYSKLRQHRDSVPHYEHVVEHCDNEELVVWSLYNLGRGLWNIDANMEGYRVFEELWTEHADNSYADDAMLYGARILRGEGDEAGYLALLERQVETFPDGDMLKDAVWLLMASHYSEQSFQEAVHFVDGLGTRTGESDLYSLGRTQYFRARALEELSLRNEARAGYIEIMRTYPMSFYSLLSFNRLREIAPETADEVMAELTSQPEDTDGSIRIEPPEVRTDPSFRRGTALLRMGLYELSEGEFGKLRARFPNEDELGWLVSLLYHRAGAFHLSHHVPGDRLGLNMWYPVESNRERWEVAYPRPFWDTVSDFAQERDLDPYIVYAIMREESGFNPGIESWANARGLLQLMIGTANDMAAQTGRGSVSASDLFDPEINIELGTMFMRTLGNLFENHPSLIIAGYNGGQGNVRSWLSARGDLPFDLWVEEIPYSQTRHYVKRVTMTYWVYRWLYEPDEPWVILPFDLSDI